MMNQELKKPKKRNEYKLNRGHPVGTFGNPIHAWSPDCVRIHSDKGGMIIRLSEEGKLERYDGEKWIEQEDKQ